MAVRVDGLRELNRAFRAAERAVEVDLRQALEEAADPVRKDAQSLAASEIRNVGAGTPWSRMRIGTARSVVYVAPVERGARGRGNPRRRGYGTGPPSFADLLMGRAMEPALERNETLIVRRVDEALDDVARIWERA